MSVAKGMLMYGYCSICGGMRAIVTVEWVHSIKVKQKKDISM